MLRPVPRQHHETSGEAPGPCFSEAELPSRCWRSFAGSRRGAGRLGTPGREATPTFPHSPRTPSGRATRPRSHGHLCRDGCRRSLRAVCPSAPHAGTARDPTRGAASTRTGFPALFFLPTPEVSSGLTLRSPQAGPPRGRPWGWTLLRPLISSVPLPSGTAVCQAGGQVPGTRGQVPGARGLSSRMVCEGATAVP